MARFPEQRLWDRIRANIGNKVHIERIENVVGSGTPDTVILAGDGRVTWVEHKVATLPKRAGTRLQWKHPLSVEQRNWHRVWNQKGGTSFILVGVSLGLFLVPGEWADEITNSTFDVMRRFKINYTELVRVYEGRSLR